MGMPGVGLLGDMDGFVLAAGVIAFSVVTTVVLSRREVESGDAGGRLAQSEDTVVN